MRLTAPIKAPQLLSVALHGPPWPSMAIRGPPWPSVALCGRPWPSVPAALLKFGSVSESFSGSQLCLLPKFHQSILSLNPGQLFTCRSVKSGQNSLCYHLLKDIKPPLFAEVCNSGSLWVQHLFCKHHHQNSTMVWTCVLYSNMSTLHSFQ